MSSSSTTPTGVTGRQLIQAVIDFVDHLASKDSTLQGLVICPGTTLVPSFLWTKAIENLPEVDDTPSMRAEILQHCSSRLNDLYTGRSAAIYIAILGSSTSETQKDIAQSFFYDVVRNDPGKSGEYSGWYGSRNGVPPIRFELEFRQACLVQHPITHLRIQRDANGQEIKILTVDPPRIILTALRALRRVTAQSAHPGLKKPSTKWIPLLLFHHAIDIFRRHGSLPPPLSEAKARQDLASLLKAQGQEGRDLRQFLDIYSKVGSGDHRKACETFIPYFSRQPISSVFADLLPTSSRDIEPPFPHFPTSSMYMIGMI